MANELLKEGLIDGGTNAMLTISAHLAMDANRYAQEHHLSEQYSYLNLPEMFQGGAEFYQSMAKFDEAKDMEKIAELTKNLSNLRSQLFA